MPDSKRLELPTTTSASFFSRLSRALTGALAGMPGEEGATFSSSKLFQAPQLGQRPNHLFSTLPQAEQTKRVWGAFT